MSTPTPITVEPVESVEPMPQASVAHPRVPHVPPEAFASLLRTIVVALFLLAFVLQPFLIPSESMERTLLVGDFLLVDKQVFAPDGGAHSFAHWLMPYRDVQRSDIVVFHHLDSKSSLVVKRVVGIPGDHLRIQDGQVFLNGVPQDEPFAVFEPILPGSGYSNFPGQIYHDPQVDSEWWHRMEKLTQNGELVIPAGQYFVLGDNRNHSKDSRYWGFVSREEIIAKPLVIYFSLSSPSTTDPEQVTNDRLGHDREFSAKLAGFARWKRIFQVVH